MAPKAGSAGWWTGSEARGNHLGDSYLYAGHFAGQPFISAILFDLASVPRGAPIKEASLRLTGLQADRFDAGAGGTWTVQLLAAESFKDLADGPARADFQQIYSAPAAVTLLPTLYPADLGQNQVNLLSLDASGREWLAQQVANGAPYVVARITGPTSGNDTLFAWDSGAGPATVGEAPKLTLSTGAAPPTPPPLPTEVVIVVTSTPSPANVLTVAAQAQTATAAATAMGTPTPPAYRQVTPTSIPANIATAQALGFAQGLPPIVVSTPVPANAATATVLARYATAVAITTGTFTPVPTDAVTPMVVLPTPIPQNVLTAAAQVRAATATANLAGTGTPLPFNAVIATLTPDQFIIMNTATPQNAATAQALCSLCNRGRGDDRHFHTVSSQLGEGDRHTRAHARPAGALCGPVAAHRAAVSDTGNPVNDGARTGRQNPVRERPGGRAAAVRPGSSHGPAGLRDATLALRPRPDA